MASPLLSFGGRRMSARLRRDRCGRCVRVQCGAYPKTHRASLPLPKDRRTPPGSQAKAKPPSDAADAESARIVRHGQHKRRLLFMQPLVFRGKAGREPLPTLVLLVSCHRLSRPGLRNRPRPLAPGPAPFPLRALTAPHRSRDLSPDLALRSALARGCPTASPDRVAKMVSFETSFRYRAANAQGGAH